MSKHLAELLKSSYSCVIKKYIVVGLIVTTSYPGMSNVKVILDCLEKFDGQKSWELWRKQFVLLTSMQQIKDAAMLFPFLLTGPALSVYMEMSEKQQTNIEEVFRVMSLAFGVRPREAYRRLQNITYSDYHTIDEYAAEVSKLAKTVKSLEIAAFLTGLPSEISLEEWHEIVEVSRTYMSIMQSTCNTSMVSLNDSERSNRLKGADGGSVRDDHRFKKSGEGVDTGGRNADEGRSKNFSQRSNMICFKCHRKGHIARFCRAGNASEGSSAPTASRED